MLYLWDHCKKIAKLYSSLNVWQFTVFYLFGLLHSKFIPLFLAKDSLHIDYTKSVHPTPFIARHRASVIHWRAVPAREKNKTFHTIYICGAAVWPIHGERQPTSQPPWHAKLHRAKAASGEERVERERECLDRKFPAALTGWPLKYVPCITLLPCIYFSQPFLFQVKILNEDIPELVGISVHWGNLLPKPDKRFRSQP